MKKLILVRGLPGSGKTTFANFLFDNLDLDIDLTSCAADDFFYDEGGNYSFDVELLHKAHLSCQQNVEIAMQRAVEVEVGGRVPLSVIIVHNTSTAPREIKTYTDLAGKYGFETTSLIVENRHGNKSVHNVPEETMEKMKNRFEVKL